MQNKKMTINDIARLAGVSKATVSFYLNGKVDKMSEETKDKIASIIEKTGYKPSVFARSMNAKSSHMIAVMIGSITNTFANQMIEGIENVCQENGYQLVVSSTDFSLDREQKCFTSMESLGVDGFIVQPSLLFPHFLQEQSTSLPIVYVDSPLSLDEQLWVKTNNFEAVYETMEALVSTQKYQHYVLVIGDPHVLQTRQERYAGFQQCLEAHGCKYDVVIANQYTTTEQMRNKLEKYIQANALFFVANNWLLQQVYESIYDHLDNDIGLVGFDAKEWAPLVKPSITTLVQPAFQEGQIAAKLLIDRIENKNQEKPNWILSCEISQGETTPIIDMKKAIHSA